MGILNSGPFGPLRGKTGNNVGRKSKKKNIFSIKPHKTSAVAEGPQLMVRDKFKMISDFLQDFSDVIEPGFKSYADGMSSMNAAMSYNLKNAVSGTFPNNTINYLKLAFSKGKKVLEPKLPKLLSKLLSTIEITWTSAVIDKGYTFKTDVATFIFYNAGKSEVSYGAAGVERIAEKYTHVLPATYIGDLLHCYMNFTSTGLAVSNSVYLGCVKIR